MKTTFPDELIQFVDRDPAVHAAYWAVRNGVALDKALIDLAVCQTRRCEELTKTAIEAVTRHSRPMLILRHEDYVVPAKHAQAVEPAVRKCAWTGMGCDICGFGSVENVDEFDPRKPCPECGQVMVLE